MANHKSAIKRIRSTKTRRDRNRYQSKTMRNALRDLRANENKQEFEKKLPEMVTMIDTLAKKNVIHKNKAGNLKSSLMKKLQSMK